MGKRRIGERRERERESQRIYRYSNFARGAEISSRKDRESGGYLDMRSHGHPVSKSELGSRSNLSNGKCVISTRARGASSSLFQFSTSSFCLG